MRGEKALKVAILPERKYKTSHDKGQLVLKVTMTMTASSQGDREELRELWEQLEIYGELLDVLEIIREKKDEIE